MIETEGHPLFLVGTYWASVGPHKSEFLAKSLISPCAS